MRTLEIECGMLVRGDIRRFLAKLKFDGMLADYMEEKHFLESKFTLKDGNPHNIAYIGKAIEEWSKY